MKLLTLGRNIFYLRGLLNIGVIANDRGEALLVDAGLDERVARQVKRVLDESGLSVKGIIITHAHADHFGGACYLAKESGARIYSSDLEKGVCETPILEALGMFGGAYPPAELRRKFFNAAKIQIHQTVSPGKTTIEDFPLEVVDLSGHTLGQVGIAVDTVLFCADSIVSYEQIQKQGILKNVNIEQSLQTCERLKARKELVFVPSHGQVLNSIGLVVTENQESINNMLALVLSMTNEPIGVEEIVARICEKKNVTINSLSQYSVFHLSILAYLGYLLDKNQISLTFNRNRQLFQRRAAAEELVR